MSTIRKKDFIVSFTDYNLKPEVFTSHKNIPFPGWPHELTKYFAYLITQNNYDIQPVRTINFAPDFKNLSTVKVDNSSLLGTVMLDDVDFSPPYMVLTTERDALSK